VPPVPPRPPNILFIVADDHQHDALGAHGNSAVRTPRLDALAARGADFRRAYFMGGLIPALCSPARACLLTGQNVIAADAAPAPGDRADQVVTMSRTAPLLPELFRSAGYRTFLTGKWHNDVPSLQRSFGAGRRIFFGGMSDHRRVPLRDYAADGDYSGAPYFEPGFSTELFCGAAVEFLAERRQGDAPFFLYLSLTSPHDPRTPPDEFARRYDPSRLPLPPNLLPDHPFDNGELEIRDEKLAAKPLSPETVRQHLADYYAMISHQDAEIGRVVDAVEKSGEAANTVVVYVSDHGLALGRHGLLGKQNLYEHSVRVPLLLSGPGVAASVVSDLPVYSLDLYATLAALAGLPTPPGLESRNLLQAGGQPAAGGRETLFALYKDVQRMVCDRRWKLIRYRVNGEERFQLFDLERDPDEIRDLAQDSTCADLLHRLRCRMADWQRAVGDRWMPIEAVNGVHSS
jgi:arylsulfatase A-like enzyme